MDTNTYWRGDMMTATRFSQLCDSDQRAFVEDMTEHYRRQCVMNMGGGGQSKTSAALQKAQAAMAAANAMQASAASAYSGPMAGTPQSRPSNPLHDNGVRSRMLADRLRLPYHNPPEFHIGTLYKDTWSRVTVIFVSGKDGEGVVFYDDVGLYPSDNLVAQVRLVMDTK